jgi:two-component system sensor histidine kinase BaeS
VRRGFARRAAVFGLVALGVFVVLVSVVVSAVGNVMRDSPAVGLVVLGLIGVAVVTAWRTGRVLRSAAGPVGELIEASARVESGQYGIEVPERGPGEIRSLVRSFNAMSRRLEATREERGRLLADVSHELRTPLTVIQGNVEAMLDGVYPADREHLERVLAETRQLEQLIDDLRTVSAAETGSLVLQRESVDLAALVRDVVTGFGAQADGAGVALTVDAPEGLPDAELDPRRMRQVLGNLVANALRHTPAGGSVAVAVRAEPGEVVIEVTDTGRGMDEATAARAFDRFWRTPDSPGAGLGLPIVRDLVAAHGGSVALTSRAGKGTTVVVRLPVAEPAAPAGPRG